MYTIIFKTSIKLGLYSGEQINSIDTKNIQKPAGSFNRPDRFVDCLPKKFESIDFYL